jgi:hypothetical protein
MNQIIPESKESLTLEEMYEAAHARFGKVTIQVEYSLSTRGQRIEYKIYKWDEKRASILFTSYSDKSFQDAFNKLEKSREEAYNESKKQYEAFTSTFPEEKEPEAEINSSAKPF